jgi:histone-lysine N-methyltransferase MLL3
VSSSRSFQRPQAEPGMKEDEEDNKMICVSTSDEWTLTQDLCVMCGALGTDLEGRLIVCTQCGQCYHPHCVNVRVSGENTFAVYDDP